MSRRLGYLILGLLLVPIVFLASAFSASAATDVTLTFVRHGESEGNVSGNIDTSSPGPHLTALGEQQADAVAQALLANEAATGKKYDAIYVSGMVRTSETAAPFAAASGMTPTALPGLSELGAGWLEGQSQTDGLGRLVYGLTPLTWALGARFIPVPGGSDGNAFDARYSGAIDQIYASGAQNPLVFSHGAAVMFWVLMNTDNPDPAVILGHQLGNTETVVVTGNPTDGWNLVSWAGQEVSQDPSLPTKLFVDFRKFVVAPQTGLYQVGQAISTGDLTAVGKAVSDGVVNVGKATIDLPTSVIRDIGDEFAGSSGESTSSGGSTSSETSTRAAAESPAATTIPEVVDDVPAAEVSAPQQQTASVVEQQPSDEPATSSSAADADSQGEADSSSETASDTPVISDHEDADHEDADQDDSAAAAATTSSTGGASGSSEDSDADSAHDLATAS